MILIVKKIGSDTNIYSTSIYQDPVLCHILASKQYKNRVSALYSLQYSMEGAININQIITQKWINIVKLNGAVRTHEWGLGVP